MAFRRLRFTLLLLACAGRSEPTAPVFNDPTEIRAPQVIAFVDVNVVPMTGPNLVAHQTVIVRDGKIDRIIPASAGSLPPEAVVINGAGRFLAPALIDMHVHLRVAHLAQYLRAGIGTVRNMWGHSGIMGLAHSIDDGTRLGPTVFSVGPGLDGPPAKWAETQFVQSAADASRIIDSLVTYGWRVMKIYQDLSPTSYAAIMDEVHRRGLKAVGHVPTAVPVLQALSSGQLSIEHLSGYDRAVSRQGRIGTWGWVDVDESRFPALVAATVAAGTWNCPTMAIYTRLAEQHPVNERPLIKRNRQQFLRALSSGGARLLIGTDSGIDVVPPGTSIYDELEEFVAAGLTPYQAFRRATVDAGTYLAVPQLGTVTVGAPAQLILLEANPLSDIRNARRLSGLVLRGEWFSVSALQALP